MKKYNRYYINQVAVNLMGELIKRGLAQDVCVYFNNIRYSSVRSKTNPYDHYFVQDEGNYNPKEYFEYAATHHILSLSFEGPLYDALNHRSYDWLIEFFEKYGLYFELGNSWNLTCYPTVSEIEEWEYFDYPEKPEPIFLYKYNALAWLDHPELKTVFDFWWVLSEKTGDTGGCVIGAKLCFSYCDKEFEMTPASPWQGEGSWTPHVDLIKTMLEALGCKNIIWDYGRLD